MQAFGNSCVISNMILENDMFPDKLPTTLHN